MGKLLLAGLGGFIGSALRYAVGGYVQYRSRSIYFPYGTLAVNLIGCFVIGFLSQLSETRGVFTAEARTLIFIGILGGFTTFSAFGNETLNLWRDGENALAMTNVLIMMLPAEGYLLRIFIGESDRHDGKLLYEWIVLKAREEGLAGATVMRGMMGFGAHSRMHTFKIERLSQDLPIIIEIVDTREKLEKFLSLIDNEIEEGMATLEKAQIHFYRSGKN